VALRGTRMAGQLKESSGKDYVYTNARTEML